MRVRVVLFGAVADRAGTRRTDVEVTSGATVESAWESLVESRPGIAPMRSILAFAVNGEYAGADASLSDGDEVAMLPPVSGG